MILVGVLAAIVGGCSMPFMVQMYGRLANAFVEQVHLQQLTGHLQQLTGHLQQLTGHIQSKSGLRLEVSTFNS